MSLILDNLTFRYGKKEPVLHCFCAEFPAGEITALTGPNGSGKTTLARIIMGILSQESGNILWSGQCLDALSMAQRGRKIGYVMQNPARQIFMDTVEKEMDYGLLQSELSADERTKRREEYLHYFEMEAYRDRFPQFLSHGEKQRLVLAAVLAMEPEYLILDEPTANLDFRSRRKLGEKLKALNRGMLLITHDQDFVEEYCHGVVEMRCADGRT